MTSLRPAPNPDAATAVAALQPAPRRTGAMRRYEVMALTARGEITDAAEIAPATPVFEAAATAFARGTPIPTPRGPIPVEDLLPGDRVETLSGVQPVLWIGSTAYVPNQGGGDSTLTRLVRVTADAFGLGRPGFDLLLGPAARMRVSHPRLRSLIGQDSVLAPVLDYTDGDRLLPVTPAGAVQLYHLMLPHHALLKIGGLEVESYHPGSDTLTRMDRDTRAAFLKLFPQIEGPQDFGDLTLTRTSRQVIDRLCDAA